MKRLIFDITDIIDYAREHDQVSGIQRVQLRVIESLIQQHGSKLIQCAYWSRTQNGYFSISEPEQVINDDFDAARVLLRLGETNAHPKIPERGTVKRALRRYAHNRQLRALKKVEFYLLHLIYPAGLARFGLPRPDEMASMPLLEKTRLESLPADDSLIFLGANWTNNAVWQMAHQHRKSGGEVLQLIHDLIPHKHPEFFTPGHSKLFSTFLENICKATTKFACVSQWTSQDLQDYLSSNGLKARIATVPLAHEFGHLPRNSGAPLKPSARVEALLRKGPFVLCVGTIEVRKNGEALLRAWQHLLARDAVTPPRLVFAGRMGWKVDGFTNLLASDRQLKSSVELFLGASDQEIAELYQSCLFTIYPSLYEGWGLPVGEAAWFGKVCVASRNTSIPEVCGNLAEYVDPTDHVSIARTVERLITTPERLKELEGALRRAPLRSWRDVADDIYLLATTSTN